MTVFLARRAAAAVLLLLVVLSATFFLVHLAPGEPAALFSDVRVTAQQRDQLRELYGLDRPLHIRYVMWMLAALRGDWGTSLSQSRPAAAVLLEALPNTALLAIAVLLVQYGLGLPLGIAAARWRDSWRDRAIRLIAFLLFAVPTFWLGLLAIELLTVRFPIFPGGHMSASFGDRPAGAGGRLLELLYHLGLPSMTLGLALCGGVIRFVRNGMLEVFGQDYIRTARAKGLKPVEVLWLHALPNTLGPVIQRFGLTLPALLSGTLIIEVIFSWPGLGRATFQAVAERDYPVILATTALSGGLVVVGSLLADLLHAAVDPRVRHG